MKKTTAAVVTVLTLAVAVGVSSCSTSTNSTQDNSNSSITVKDNAVLGSASASASASATPDSSEQEQVKTTVDSFYAAISDDEKVKSYVGLMSSWQQDENITQEQRVEAGKKFFAEDIKRFDPETVSEDDAFYLLSIATLASALIDEKTPVTTVPVEAITIDGDRATVDLGKVGKDETGIEAQKETSSVNLVKKNGTWLISSYPGAGQASA